MLFLEEVSFQKRFESGSMSDTVRGHVPGGRGLGRRKMITTTKNKTKMASED